MTERISHTEAHEFWSAEQLVLFRQMDARERVNTVKSGALEHWTEAARAAALDLLSENGSKATNPSTSRTRHFEPARHLLPEQIVRAARVDQFMIAAGGGWTAIMIATAAHVFGLY